MPFTSPKRIISDAENKLRLLDCVRALEQVTETQLWPFVASLQLMEYIPMQLFLHELLLSGDLDTGVEALSGLISLSPQGQETLRLFAHRVMPSDRERIDRAAPAYRSQMQKRRQIRAIYESAREGDYHMLFSISDGEVPTLSIRMQTVSRELATQSLHAFEMRAASILAYLYSLDMSVVSEEESANHADVSRPVLTTHSPREHTVTAMLSAEGVRFELALLLPGIDAATRFMGFLSLPARQKAVAERLFALLCGTDG
jgi:hypothetical protein